MGVAITLDYSHKTAQDLNGQENKNSYVWHLHPLSCNYAHSTNRFYLPIFNMANDIEIFYRFW